MCHDGSSEISKWLPDWGLNDDLDSFYCGKNVEFDFCDDHYSDWCGGWKGAHGAGNIKVGWMKFA